MTFAARIARGLDHMRATVIREQIADLEQRIEDLQHELNTITKEA